jgi:gas vesicle protein
MAFPQDKIDQLKAFRQRDKFSTQAWNKRGLNPSSTELSARLTQLFDECADALIAAVQSNKSDKQLKSVLKAQLSKFNKRDYDTEEKEFICDLFYELAQILDIDFTDNVSRWLYGLTLTTLLKIKARLNPKKVLDTIHQTCPTCTGALDTFIMRKENGIPDYSWMIVQCKKCKDYSIVSIGPNVKEIRFGNYDLIEQLPKSEFTEEQAAIRLEQIRHFRK